MAAVPWHPLTSACPYRPPSHTGLCPAAGLEVLVSELDPLGLSGCLDYLCFPLLLALDSIAAARAPQQQGAGEGALTCCILQSIAIAPAETCPCLKGAANQ